VDPGVALETLTVVLLVNKFFSLYGALR